MKERLEKIKERLGDRWLENILMAAFVCAALALNASEIAGEAAEVFGRNVSSETQSEEVETTASESTETMESALEEAESTGETGLTEVGEGSSGSETEPDTDEADSEASKTEKKSDEEQDKASGTEKESDEESDQASNTKKKSDEEQDKASEAEKESDEESDQASKAEKNSDGEKDKTSETEKESDEEQEKTSKKESESEDTLQQEPYRLYTLKDTKILPDIEPLVLMGEYDEEQYAVLSGEQPVRGIAILKSMIENQIAKYDGDWSVYVRNLNTDERFVVNDQPMKSASIMKLFIMGTVYKAIDEGALARTSEVMDLMNQMITVSDNESSNRLLYLLGDGSYEAGIAVVNQFIQEYGFSDMTVEYNGFNNSATVTDSSSFNQVSAKDCGKLLEDIYRRTWVNRSVSNEIEQMLLNQHTRYKIPAGLPDGVLCGNKSGEMDTTENDAAIVYAEECDYILVVLSSDWNSKDEAISRIASISSVVYEYLTEN
jgi:beta-lactamase class A